MRLSMRWGLALALLAAAMVPAAAHSVAELQQLLGSTEKYFQVVEKPSPSFTLRDPQGKPISLADFRGKVVVLHFIYTRCPDVCPLHADRIAEIQKMVNQTPMRQQVEFVTVTTDPENDQPDVMRAYGARHGLDPSNWTFLTAGAGQPEDATRKLAEQFGHKFVKQDGFQVHGVVTHVIDKEGRWRANFHGLTFEPTNLVIVINALANDDHTSHGPSARSGAARGTWDRIKERLGL